METQNYKLLILTVATEKNDCFYRWENSLTNFPNSDDVETSVKVLGLNKDWLGGDMALGMGGGFKINLVKEFLKTTELDENTFILFTDCYDVIFNNTTFNHKTLIKHLQNSGADVIFSAEKFCYPYPALANNYPQTSTHYRFLNSGIYLGTLKGIKEIINFGLVENTDDDQGYFTKIFLEQEKILKDTKIKLDSNCEIFQCMHGEFDNVDINTNSLINKITNTRPLCIHGNGTQIIKDQISYIWNVVNPEFNGSEYTQKFSKGLLLDEDYLEKQEISILTFTRNQTDLENVLKLFNSLEYFPKDLINLKIAVKKNEPYQYSLLSEIENVDLIFYDSNPLETFKEALTTDKHLLVLNNVEQLENPYIIQIALSNVKNFVCFYTGLQNTSIKSFGNLEDLIKSEKTAGIFEISSFEGLPFYINKNLVAKLRKANFGIENLEHILCEEVKKNFDIVHCDCRYDFLGKIETEKEIQNVQNALDIQEIQNVTIFDYFSKKEEWEERYITTFARKRMWDMIVEPISGVISFPLFTPQFCKEFIEHAESIGKWRGDRHIFYPTTDMLLEVLGFEEIYYAVLKDYVFTSMIDFWKLDGKAWYDMVTESFVVRYKPSEQASLALHHDSSMYSVVLTLNRDFTGGGTYFEHLKQVHIGNVGEVTVHPGQITHKHAGRLVESGTRYIIVSFCNKP